MNEPKGRIVRNDPSQYPDYIVPAGSEVYVSDASHRLFKHTTKNENRLSGAFKMMMSAPDFAYDDGGELVRFTFEEVTRLGYFVFGTLNEEWPYMVVKKSMFGPEPDTLTADTGALGRLVKSWNDMSEAQIARSAEAAKKTVDETIREDVAKILKEAQQAERDTVIDPHADDPFLSSGNPHFTPTEFEKKGFH